VIKTTAFVAALVIGFATAGYAQTSSPAGENSTAQKSGNMGSSNGSSATRPSGTTGMSSGGGSARTSTGGANGNPSMAPKTTTGPQGPASESESPAK
jgi:hypothetical protein